MSKGRFIPFCNVVSSVEFYHGPGTHYSFSDSGLEYVDMAGVRIRFSLRDIAVFLGVARVVPSCGGVMAFDTLF